MIKTKNKFSIKRSLYGLAAALLTLIYFPLAVSASAITAKSVVMGSSVASASTTYNFTFTAPTASNIQSVRFQACDSASGACTQTGAASGFSSGSGPATLSEQPTGLGSGGSWTINTGDATALRISNASNTGNPSAGATVNFSGVRNPSATNSTFYMRITTFSDSNYTTSVDTGTIAVSTAGQITVTANVDEALTFTLAGSTVALGTVSSSSTGSGISSMTVGTNATSGYTLSYAAAPTLTSGSNTLTAMAGVASAQGQKQFGINLMDNTTPNIGANKSGTGSGAVDADYGTADTFRFLTTGDQIAAAAAATNDNVYTVSYIANVSTDTAAGAYSTAITYIATANF